MMGLLEAIAAFDLPGARPLPDEPLDGARWAALADGVHQHKLIGLLAQAVASGAFPVTRAQHHRVAADHLEAMSLVLVLERQLLRSVEHLTSAGIDYRVIKGPAVARTAYPDPSWRPFRDVDLLVRAEQLDLAIARLAQIGYQRRLPELRPGFDRRFGKGATLLNRAGHEIDLHRTFVAGRYGLLSHTEDVFHASSTVLVGSAAVLTLSPAERFLNACYHAALGGPGAGLGAQRDVVQMMRSADHDPAAVRRLAHAWGGEAVVALAVREALGRLGVEGAGDLAEWSADYRTRGVDRRALRTYTAHRSFSRQALAGVTILPGVEPKLAYLAGVASARHMPGHR